MMKSKILISIGLGLCMLGGCECPKNPFDPSPTNGNSNLTNPPAATPTPTVPPVYSNDFEASVAGWSSSGFTISKVSVPAGGGASNGSFVGKFSGVGSGSAAYMAFTASTATSAVTTVTFDMAPFTDSTTTGTNQIYVVVGYNGTVRAAIGYNPSTSSYLNTICYLTSGGFTGVSGSSPFLTQGSMNNHVRLVITSSDYTAYVGGIALGTNAVSQSMVAFPASGWYIGVYSTGTTALTYLDLDNILVAQ